MLRDYVRQVLIAEGRKKIKRKSGKFATISTQSAEDMSQILLWLRSHKAIRSAGQIKKSDNSYIVRVKVNPKVGRSGVFNLVKDRFGMFARVK
tara:strand:- start:194 stop:472 length:279 start_codon:yes stop_codon:yes gene_type:complete